MDENPISTSRATLNKDLSSLKQGAAQVAQDVKDHAEAHVTVAKQRFNERVQAAREAAAARPLMVLGVGFALGYIFAASRRK